MDEARLYERECPQKEHNEPHGCLRPTIYKMALLYRKAATPVSPRAKNSSGSVEVQGRVGGFDAQTIIEQVFFLKILRANRLVVVSNKIALLQTQ